MVFHAFRAPVRYATRYQDDPFVSMQRAIQRGFEDVLGNTAPDTTQAAAMSIRLDVKEDDKGFHVTADLPGLSEKEVDVTFEDGLLTVRGEKKVERDDKKDTWHIIERSYGSFARQLALPTTIDANKIEAKFDKGVLHIELPKQPVEQTSAKKITIKTA